jgi:hypothetical protein
MLDEVENLPRLKPSISLPGTLPLRQGQDLGNRFAVSASTHHLTLFHCVEMMLDALPHLNHTGFPHLPHLTDGGCGS